MPMTSGRSGTRHFRAARFSGRALRGLAIPCTAFGLAAVTLLATAPQAAAQAAPPAGTAVPARVGLTLTPFVSLSAIYDDNVFLSATNPKSDTIITLSPGALLNYHSRHTDFDLFYSFTAAKFTQHENLSDWLDEQHALIGYRHRFTRDLEFGTTATYAETHNPGQLSPQNGLVVGRNRATRTTVNPELSYTLSPKSSMKLSYEHSWQHIDTGGRIETGTSLAGYTRQLTEHDTLNLLLQNISYDFNNGSSPNSTLFTAGWTHDFTRWTSMTLSAGPRYTSGQLTAEILASVGYHSRFTTLSLAYRKTQSVVIGQSELLDTQGISATLAFTPARNFTFGLSPSYYRNSGSTVDTRSWRLRFYMWYRFAPAWALGLTYNYQHQQGTFSSGSPATLKRNIVALTLRWQLPGRGEESQIAVPPRVIPGR